MTIRLLSAFDRCPPNSIVTLDSATEAGMVANKTASFDLTGGVPFVPQPSPLEVVSGSFATRARRARKVFLPEGKVIVVTGSAVAGGKADRLGAGDASLQSWTVGTASLVIGPFVGAQKILIACLEGNIDAMVVDASVASRSPSMSGVSLVLAPSATWNNATGSFTLGVDLPTTFSGGAWVRFSAKDANGSTGGPAASLYYWCIFSTARIGQAYTASIDPATPFTPDVPAGPLTPLATVAGTHVQATNVEITMLNLLVVGTSMGNRGGVDFTALTETANTAGTKSVRTRFGGAVYNSASFGAGTMSLPINTKIFNCGAPNIQVGTPSNTATGLTGSTSALTRGAADTNFDQSFLLTIQMSSSSDYYIITAFIFELKRPS